APPRNPPNPPKPPPPNGFPPKPPPNGFPPKPPPNGFPPMNGSPPPPGVNGKSLVNVFGESCSGGLSNAGCFTSSRNLRDAPPPKSICASVGCTSRHASVTG